MSNYWKKKLEELEQSNSPSKSTKKETTKSATQSDYWGSKLTELEKAEDIAPVGKTQTTTTKIVGVKTEKKDKSDLFWGWLGNSAMSGVAAFNKGFTATADLLLGKPLQAFGWKDNPISNAAEYYADDYDMYKNKATTLAKRLGGDKNIAGMGNGYQIAGELLEGTVAAVPMAVEALATGGGSLTDDLATAFTYRSGNLLQKAGLTVEKMMSKPSYWLSFAQTYGNDYEEAVKSGVDENVALYTSMLSSLINAGIEIGIDGASGIQGLPKKALKGDKSALMEWVQSSLEEGGEEVLQGVVSRGINDLSNGADGYIEWDEDTKIRQNEVKVFDLEQMLKEGLMGTAVGGILGGGQIGVQSSVNAVQQAQANKLTADEQAVVDKVVETRITEEELAGKPVTASEKRAIEKQVREELEKGRISIETIEEVLGGDSYKAYHDTVAKEDILKKEYDILYKMKNGEKSDEQIDRQAELKRQLEELKTTSQRDALRQQLDDALKGKVDGTRLAESYNERARRGQTFEADISKYNNAKQQKIVQKAIDSGILNNTRRTHEFVDMIAKISADKGVSFDFTDNERLKESGFSVEGAVVNGYVNDAGDITLNINSSKATRAVVGHEVTHILEGTALYEELQNVIEEYAQSRGEYESRLESLTKLYKGKKGYETDFDAKVRAELTADLVGDYLFDDADFINNLSTKHRNVFQKIYDEIKYLCKVATAGSAEARELEKVKKAFEDAYRADSKASGDTKYSMSGVNANIDKSQLAIAEQMEADGKSSEEIRQSTGWFRSYDNQWRYEIDDSKAVWHLDTAKPDQKHLFNFGEKEYKLKDLLDHKELYEAYPQLEDVTVYENPHTEHGGYVIGRSTQSIAIKKLDDSSITKMTLTHEIQHLIQNIEGFARGASKHEYSYKEWGEKEYEALQKRNEIATKLYAVLRRHGQTISKDDIYYNQHSFNVSDEIVESNYMLLQTLGDQNKRTQDLIDAYYEQRLILNATTPEGQYYATAGEVEAYDVQGRMRMSAEERKATRPNIDRTDAIVKYSLTDNTGKTETDTAYMDAVNRGDTDAVQKMVDEAAKKAGYNSPKLYHGTGAFGFTRIDTRMSNDRISFFATDSLEAAGTYSGTGNHRNISETQGSSAGVYQFYANTDGMVEFDANGEESNRIELGLMSRDFNDYLQGKYFHTHATAKQIAKYAKWKGYTGAIIKNVIDTATPDSRKATAASTIYIFFDPKTKIKSADPITYDDNGNVVPLSQRFKHDNPDIRYSLSDIDGKPIDSERISTDELDTKYSLSHSAEIAKGQSDYLISHKAYVTDAELKEAQRVTAAMVDVMMNYSSILPEDKIGKVLTKNGSYDRSVENTTICVRTLAYNEFVDKVQEEIGRPLTQMESFLVSQKMYDIATDPQCLYCYVSLDRKAFNDMLLRYMQDRDTVIAKYNNSDKTDATIESLYEEFLHGRKPTTEMRKRFDSWISYVDNGTQLLSLADIATEARQAEIAGAKDNVLAEQLKDARKYAQSASWSKIQKDYVAYRDEILKLGDKVVKNLNEHYGMRWYSFSDYSAAFIVENMQQITDASIRGLKGLSYTKDTDYAEIFAPSGMNINISVFVNTDADGNFFIDEKQSANFQKALELRDRYPNVGIVATVTNDEALRWAGEQEWSDVIIPFHIVRTGTDVAEYYKWLNYTAESADTIGDKDMWNAYLDSLNLSDNARKRVSKNIYPSEHKNDKATYLNLCESRGLTPRFARFAGEDWYMKLVNETRLSADNSSALKPIFNEDAAKASFDKFIEKGGYEGGWYRDGVDVDAEAKIVAADVLAGKKANEVSYGRQDGFVPEDLIAGRKTNRQHGKHSLSYEGETHRYRGDAPMSDLRYEAPVQETVQEDIAPIQDAPIAENSIPDVYAPATEEQPESVDSNKPITTVEERLAAKLQNAEAELAKNQQLRQESLDAFNEKIDRLKEEYESKKNKDTKVANDILKRIERQSRLRDDVDADYAKRISDLAERINKMNSPVYKRAEQRMAKHEEYTTQMENLVGDTSTWVDKKLGISYKTNTLRRNLRDIVRDANGNRDIAKADAIYEELQGKYNHNEAILNKEATRIKQPYAEMKINKAEDAYIQMLGELRHNPDTTLTEDAVLDYYNKHKEDIDKAKVDKAIAAARETYDSLLTRVNAVLKEQGMKEIPYRQGYFPHFTDPKQGFLAKLFNWKTKDFDIPTDIAGLTEQFNPNRSWQSFNKERKSDTTDYSFTKGMDTYVQGALDWIYHIEDIQKRRAFENHIRFVHSDEGIKERINKIRKNEEYDADEMQEQIDLVYKEARNPLNNFVTDLRAGTNTLAGKKSSLDRGMEEMVNRKAYSTMTNLSNRVTGNMVVGSISSALTNFIPITQSWAEVSPVKSLRAMSDTIRSTFRDDGTIAKSDFLTNRLRKADDLYKTGWDKVADKATFLMEGIDSFTSQVVWRSKYLDNISQGMSENAAIKNADQFAESVIAGRSRGNMPTIFDSKNPLIKTLTAFQLEVNNQYGYMFKDVPQDMKDKSVGKLVAGYAAMFFGAYAYNALYSSLTGRDAAFDPIRIIENLLAGIFDDDEEKEPTEIAVDFAEDVLQEVPFVGGLLGGGRIPISSAMPYDGVWDAITGTAQDVADKDYANLTKEWLNPVYYLAMPMGGGQIKKTAEGVGMFVKPMVNEDKYPISGSYTTSGDLRFPVEKTFGNVVQAGLFGQYASKNAREYFDNDYAPLGKKQIAEYAELDLPIKDYWEYRDGLKGLDSTTEKLDYIDSLDLPIDKKSILAYNIATDNKDIANAKDAIKRYGDFQVGENHASVGGVHYRWYEQDDGKAGWRKLSKDELAKQNEVTKALGITPEQYWGNKAEYDMKYKYPEKYAVLQEQGISVEEYKEKYEDSAFIYTDDFSWAADNPSKYAISKAVAGDVIQYRKYTSELSAIEADKDEDGKSISGSRKEKVLDYINGMDDLDYGQKIILYRSMYSSKDDKAYYNAEIVDYLNSRDDISYDEMVTILEELDMTVDSNGSISW